MAECMITGCDLHYEEGYIHGDLFESGDNWIFNAVGEPSEEAPGYAGGKLLSVLGDKYFERRNVFVIRKDNAILNQIAVEYLKRGRIAYNFAGGL